MTKSLFRQRFNTYFLLIVGIVALNLSACSINQPVLVAAPTDAQIKNILTPLETIHPKLLEQPAADILALNPAMKNIVKQYINPDDKPEKRLDTLFEILRYNPDYAIKYDSQATYTAEEVYKYRRANCLAFSAMFIALAREAGLKANFQEVELPPEWDALSDDTLVQYRHVNVKVDLPRGGNGVIDFRMDRYSETFPQEIISDKYALAQYYSNISMQLMVERKFDQAYVAALRALEVDPGQSFIWSNMGIIQRRMGNRDLAEIAYRQALTIDPRDISASNNLSILYEADGNFELAEQIRRYSELTKLNNPYYRYALAQHAYRNGNFDEALSQIKVAMRKQSREHRFYFLRGLSLWNKGEEQSAINNVKRAIRMAKDDEPITVYEQQLAEWHASNG